MQNHHVLRIIFKSPLVIAFIRIIKRRCAFSTNYVMITVILIISWNRCRFLSFVSTVAKRVTDKFIPQTNTKTASLNTSTLCWVATGRHHLWNIICKRESFISCTSDVFFVLFSSYIADSAHGSPGASGSKQAAQNLLFLEFCCRIHNRDQ